ncbi:MAG: hypothetical protein NVV66_16465 [Cellulomonas sp.]|uniref:hypothetical protein n=1 Tax=Cellulomonas sp. TaxID=40001 RepID=UPI002588BD19|nr:hypothetical protein [Cellulomonas sp.]MCR6706209.1 hypothetical protein [Cellulomonas sp.]
MLYAINREGDPADILYTEDVAAMLGVTVHTLHKLADVGRALKPIAKVGAGNVYRRAGIWSFMTRSNAGKAKTGRCRASQCGGTGTVGRNGLCPRHRNAYEVLGDAALALVLPIVRRSATLAEKVAANVVTEPTTACLIWIGARCSDGYGSVKDASGRTVAVHRAAFEIALGRPIADLMEPDHECGQRAACSWGPVTSSR